MELRVRASGVCEGILGGRGSLGFIGVAGVGGFRRRVFRRRWRGKEGLDDRGFCVERVFI